MGPPRIKTACAGLTKASNVKEVNDRVTKAQYEIAAWLVTHIADRAQDLGSILIFVSGIFDIMELTELVEKQGPKYQCLAIHSDIPFEDQLEAFQPASEGRVKVNLNPNPNPNPNLRRTSKGKGSSY